MKMIFLFPGYGSQFVGMGKEFYDEFRIVQEFFEEAANCLNINFVKLCFASSEAEMSRATNAYPALFLISSSIVGLLKEKGIVPTVVSGYNQGQMAALFSAGSINFPDGLYLLSKYAQIFEQCLENMDVSMMRVHNLPAERIEELCLTINKQSDYTVFVAIYESIREQIVAGDTPAVHMLKEILKSQKGVYCDDVSPYIGLHSPLMNPVVEKFKMYLEKVDFKELALPLIEDISGKRIQDNALIKELVTKSMVSSIGWTKVVDQLDEYDVVIEIGPGSRLSTLIKEQYPEKQVLSINTIEDFEKCVALSLEPVEAETTEQEITKTNKEETTDLEEE